jgi:septal ring factor EnvC (AmiA/AmiB activator)
VRLVSGLASLVLVSTLAHAEPATIGIAPAPPYDAHPALVEQVGAELQTLDKTLAIVDDKLSAAEAARLARVRAAYRILRAPLADDASASDRMASARRRSAARLLLDRDREERTLLANEASALRSALETTVVASETVPTVVLPESLLQPVRGTIARTFGTIRHERSRTTLSRRGLDFEVEVSAPVVAPADGTVRYAGPMRGLENGIILDHGDYFTVVAKLAEVAIPVGTKITRGDRIGHAARHRVYLEVRAKVGPGGLPIDPQPLLVR